MLSVYFRRNSKRWNSGQLFFRRGYWFDSGNYWKYSGLGSAKYITGAGELLTGKMLTFDGLTMRFRTVNFGSPSKGCRVCGEHADIHELRPEEYPMPGCSI